MIKNKAIQIIRTFSKDDIKNFGLYLNSPYFNSNNNLIKLFAQIEKDLTKLDEESFTEEVLYGLIFPGRKYNYNISKNLFSSLHDHLCRFLSVDRFLSSRSEPIIPLLKELMERRLIKSSEKAIRDVREYLAEPGLSAEEYHIDFSVEEYSNFLNYHRDHRWMENLAKKSNPLRMSEKLLIYFLMRLLNQYLFYTYKMFIINAQSSRLIALKNIIDAAYSYLSKDSIIDPNIEVLYHVIQMREYPDEEERFYLAKGRLLKFIERIASQVFRNAFSYLQTYCTDKFEQGRDEYLMESFLLLRLNVESKYTLIFIRINPDMFEDVVTTGLVVGEQEYVKSFIKKYEQHLPETQRNQAYNYSLALLAFYSGSFDEAFGHLSNIEIEHPYVNLNVRKLYLMLYYETSQWEGLYSYIASFKAFLKNDKKFDPEIKKSYFNFIRAIYDIAKIKEKIALGDKDAQLKLEFLISRIKKDTSVFRIWLLQKADALL